MLTVENPSYTVWGEVVGSVSIGQSLYVLPYSINLNVRVTIETKKRSLYNIVGKNIVPGI